MVSKGGSTTGIDGADALQVAPRKEISSSAAHQVDLEGSALSLPGASVGMVSKGGSTTGTDGADALQVVRRKGISSSAAHQVDLEGSALSLPGAFPGMVSKGGSTTGIDGADALQVAPRKEISSRRARVSRRTRGPAGGGSSAIISTHNLPPTKSIWREARCRFRERLREWLIRGGFTTGTDGADALQVAPRKEISSRRARVSRRTRGPAAPASSVHWARGSKAKATPARRGRENASAISSPK